MTLLFLLCGLFLPGEAVAAAAVTYHPPNGRLGDNLVAYMHAKWASYRYGIPLLCPSFILSHHLVLDDVEIKQTWTHTEHAVLQYQQDLASFLLPERDLLYFIPYFPEYSWELARYPYPYFAVDWKDPDFLALLRSLIAPKIPLTPLILPKDKTTVAVHIRKGDHLDYRLILPLKFPPEEFFITELRHLYFLLGERPLYVHLFTDEPDPSSLKTLFVNALQGLDIEITSRERVTQTDTEILADFFALTQFACAIRGESNFSMVAGILADYQVEIFPTSCHIVGDTIYIDEVTVVQKPDL